MATMMKTFFSFFDTAIGACGIAWDERGVIGTWLPESDAAALRRRVVSRLDASLCLPRINETSYSPGSAAFLSA